MFAAHLGVVSLSPTEFSFSQEHANMSHATHSLQLLEGVCLNHQIQMLQHTDFWEQRAQSINFDTLAFHCC